jgi:hypothetical protein
MEMYLPPVSPKYYEELKLDAETAPSPIPSVVPETDWELRLMIEPVFRRLTPEERARILLLAEEDSEEVIS